MCDKVRIDATDNNTGSFSQQIAEVLDDGAGTVYFIWAECPAGTNQHNRVIKIRSYVPATATFGTEHTVDDVSTGNVNDIDTGSIGAVRLDSGRIIVGYGLFGVQAIESNDNGVTWGTRIAVDGTSGLSTRSFCSIATDGTNVHIITQERSGGANTLDVFAFKRTGVETWDGGTKIHDAKTSGAEPYFAPTSKTRQLILTDNNTACWIHDYRPIGGSEYTQIMCLSTIDGWTTVTETVVATYAIGAERAPKLRMGRDGRIRGLWIDTDAGSNQFPVLIYSGTVGLTWNVIGTPAVMMGDYAWDENGNRGFALTTEDGWFISSLDNESEAGAYLHRLFTGGDALTGWVLTSCELSFSSWSGGGSDEGFISGTKFIRCFNFSTGTEYQVNFLTEALPPPSGGPDLVEESPSGSDATNIVLRNRLSTKRGWSAHDWPFSCFSLWPEGDYTTQRRLPTKIAGASIIDPSVASPVALPALFAFDVPEHYGRERFMYDETDTLVPRLDPFYRQAHTKAFAITNGVGVAIVRGVFVRYRRAGAPLSVQIWIDGVLVQTYSLPITGAAGGPDDIFPIKEVFLPVPRITNVGSFCQFRFEDESLYPFAIERVAIKKIDKKQRARNQGL